MPQLTVEHLKSCCPPECVAKLDAVGFNWASLISALPQLLAILMPLFGQNPPAPAPTPATHK